MNSYLKELAVKSIKVRRQLAISYGNQRRLPEQNPYGRNHFTIPQTTKAEHLYPNIILLKVTPACLGECAFCFRQKQRAEELREITKQELDGIFDGYVQNYNLCQKEDLMKIREILITGGEPFLSSVKFLEKILEKSKNLGINLIRIGSRAISASPWLINRDLVAMLKNFSPLTIVAHFNHADELTKESLVASERVLSAGITIKNQSVLLRGVNDSVDELCNLNWELLRNSIQPYRLNHCMPVGYESLRTTVKEGIDLVANVQSMGGSIGHFHYNVITPFGSSPGFNKFQILDEKKGADLLKTFRQNPQPFLDISAINRSARYLKIEITSKTIKDSYIPKETWYRDGEPKILTN